MAHGILEVGTVDAVPTGASPLVVTANCPTGFKIGDVIYFGEGGGSGGANLGSSNDHETYDSAGRNWYAVQFSPSGQQSSRIWQYAVVAADGVVGTTSKTFTMTGGGIGFAQNGGTIPEGVVLRASTGYDSSHRILNASISVAGTYNDYGRSASGATPRVASFNGHAGETAANDKQIVAFYVAHAAVTPPVPLTGLTDIVVTGAGDIVYNAQLSTDESRITLFGYELLTPDSGATEGAYTATLSFDGGGSSTLLVFREVERHLIEDAPVAAFTVSVVDNLQVVVDMSASTDPEDGVPTSWDVDWGDGFVQTGFLWNSQTTEGYTYATPGTYTVTVTVYDQLGVSDDVSHDITVDIVRQDSQDFAVKPTARKVRIGELPYEVTSGMFDDLVEG